MYLWRRRFREAVVVSDKATENSILVDRLPVARLRFRAGRVDAFRDRDWFRRAFARCGRQVLRARRRPR